VKRLGLVAAVLMISAMGAAQMMSSHPQANGADPHAGMQNMPQNPGQNPHSSTQSSRAMFGKECGIADYSSQSAAGFSRSPEGQWSAVTKDKRPGPNDNALARVWHESHWMVDLHDSPGDGTTMHTGQMCFDANGQIMRMIDRYMDVPKCGCMRYTALNFDASGKAAKQEQKYVKVDTGAEIAAPAAGKNFPETFGFRRLEQLPFYSLVKK
jgi:hypothetical protein